MIPGGCHAELEEGYICGVEEWPLTEKPRFRLVKLSKQEKRGVKLPSDPRVHPGRRAKRRRRPPTAAPPPLALAPWAPSPVLALARPARRCLTHNFRQPLRLQRRAPGSLAAFSIAAGERRCAQDLNRNHPWRRVELEFQIHFALPRLHTYRHRVPSRMGDERLVLERILDGHEGPTDLSLPLLRSITDNFSQERLIGRGGFGDVYKGILQNGMAVAVKRMYMNQHTVDDKPFRREISGMMNTNHPNVVRFLGFSSHTYDTAIQDSGSGETVLAKVNERLLCFEYLLGGSLDKHITDELRGFGWEMRYNIITGICKGLCYLHMEKNIIHMDLRPTNILLDDHMIPKITDFSLSRPIENSHDTGDRFGTLGYSAPEYIIDGIISVKSDIYSLGAIIIQLVTGYMDVPDKNNVLRRWRHRQKEPAHRPSILEIISILTESETDGHTGQLSHYVVEDDMLEIKPLKLRLPSKLKKEISRSIELTNDTLSFIAFSIKLPNLLWYNAQPDKGIVQPLSKYGVKITVQPQAMYYADKIIVCSTKVSEGLRDEDITECMFSEAAIVDEVDLMVVYEPRKSQKNGKSIIDATMPAKEVPKVNKRKSVESVSGKGKLSISEQAEVAPMAKKRNIVKSPSGKGKLGSSKKAGMERPYDALEKKLHDSNATPMAFPIEFLEAITCNFSAESILGEGGFGVVYKGVLACGKIIAVKKLFETRLNEKAFEKEVCYLIGIKHPNIVQLLGYCAESKWEAMELPRGSGKYILADTPKRLLCFEYVCKESLNKHISDESSGLEWNMRFEVIKGICNGLHFLHEKCHIVHLDLKPENILMDSTMMPKIADFGLSRIFGEQQSQIVTNSKEGTRGYMAPEYIDGGVVSYKADIFSLGVIVIEIITGGRNYPWDYSYLQQDSPHPTDPSFQQFKEKVLGSWKDKFVSTPKYQSVEKYTQQVKQCVTIALKCVEHTKEKRPTTKDIIEKLNAVDQIGDTHFEMRERICYSRGQLLKLRETTDVAEEIIRVKQEIDAKLHGEDQNLVRSDSDVERQTQGQAQNQYTEPDNRDWSACMVLPPGAAVADEMDWEDQLSSQFASKTQIGPSLM